ncbi:hypothetical protein BCD67_18590 [Oscillatoriales cyanobacterium USR001]|nr:hypothetical protein BCD67_18590 [Oscillatoriales cyanobacterium USR001]
MIQELIDLRASIVEGRYDDALAIVDELDWMSKKTILRNIKSYLVRLLVHLIKNQVEQRLTNSWAASIGYSVVEIQDLNLMDNQISYYVKQDEWDDYLENAFEDGILAASSEVANGVYKPRRLREIVDKEAVIKTATQLLSLTYTYSGQTLRNFIYEEFSQLAGGEAWSFEREN